MPYADPALGRLAQKRYRDRVRAGLPKIALSPSRALEAARPPSPEVTKAAIDAYPSLRRYVTQRGWTDGEDLLHDAYRKLFERGGQVQDATKVRYWLRTTLSHLATDRGRAMANERKHLGIRVPLDQVIAEENGELFSYTPEDERRQETAAVGFGGSFYLTRELTFDRRFQEALPFSSEENWRGLRIRHMPAGSLR